MRSTGEALAARAATATLACLVLGACGGDDAVTSPPPAGPPSPVLVELPAAPFLGSAEPVAQAAEDTVAALLAAIGTPTAMQTALAAVDTLAWSAHADCLVARDPAGGSEYRACPLARGWAWDVVAADHTLFAGETDATGREGDFRTTGLRWAWLATASRDSVEWSYDREGEIVVLHWSRDQEAARLWLWSWSGVRRVGYRTAAARATGWCESHDWSAEGWVLRQEIAWDAGHGRWLTFDAAGREIHRAIW